ncbi:MULTISPECIES: selenocysteine synthase [Agrobacterium]|uniref:L-seryl-tRNA(Ser) seleniumtransferase n=1 Tax=Agrobacterium tumefaciens TaxID=358 RepID=A0AAW8M351_AGRTU|nr:MULTISPECIES: selenocysteine synthase [Agrobacterium]MBP2511527.1 L-seryl-tRNA(Ser) seleniumtransferase [Agrobacterium tumefaciens]MBP2520758.1 L-seryl-tRNA(Ser) seleniumtransferase [Agrobacterium tumefaciens]MBP2537533.1 L-seryl-tRNA(Ser) seleniumtransferase [Agrobacterium tumefaciens]MBP2542677.1 L-seryl-tRNA(Ser) seleniumtransferase [Agrobacterium tumefaciens]MBP2568690.1 L-seryl-tRNA(Ser) seleniumtransferase [Agrobacterium tumefaciens]
MSLSTQKSESQTARRDTFGNEIDPVVGFARGSIIKSSIEEAKRLRHGQTVAAKRVQALGPRSIGVFTGNQRDFPVRPEDLNTNCEEWIGPGLYAEELRTVAIEHLGGRSDDGCAVFNRTSAGIVATIAALAGGKPVLSVVPAGDRSHASVVRGCALARVGLKEVTSDKDWRIHIADCYLVIVTTVTSALARLDDALTIAVVEEAHRAGAIVFLDEAYGARLRPVLHGGQKALALGADIAITNCDKAGLSGPRAGVLVGRSGLVMAAAAKAAEYGMEARAPIAAAVLRSLQKFDPRHLKQEAAAGQELAAALEAAMGGGVVMRSDLGPMINEDAVLAIILERASISAGALSVVPCEATAALGMLLLADHGILTVNTHGQPGARVSLRLKPTLDALASVGGVSAVVDAVDECIAKVAAIVTDKNAMKTLILGDLA